MEYINETNLNTQTAKILCCECGTPIDPNPSNMCVACLRSQVDITEGIQKQTVLYFCKGCERYLQPPDDWVRCPPESRELLALCLKKVKGLNKVKLIDASFIWTEPHSKRIKVKLTVHGELQGGAVLQQVFIVEFIVNHYMCNECHRSEAQDFWRTQVQVRQKTDSKKTLCYLEQLILKHKAHENTLGIKPVHGGLDFFYTAESHARKMVDFLSSVLPCKAQHSKKLISHDIHSNKYNYKFTFAVEIVPVSKDSLVCLPKKLAHQLAGISQICLVFRISNMIHLIDPCSAQTAEVNGVTFWRNAFSEICMSKQLVEYIVMDIEPIMDAQRNFFPGQGNISTKHVLSDVWIVKASELGINDSTIHTRTHLGHVLKPGDSVMGYNLEDSNINDPNFDNMDKNKIPDVVLVKKYYGDRSAKRRQRIWKLKRLVEDGDELNVNEKEFGEFLDDLEEDPLLRQGVNIYKDSSKITENCVVNAHDATELQISLEEMLDDLVIDDVEMAEN